MMREGVFVVLNRKPRWPAPARDGWVYVEYEYDIEFHGWDSKAERLFETGDGREIGSHLCTMTYRGWVKPSAMRSRRRASWLSHELLTKFESDERAERYVRTRKHSRDPKADYTSTFLSAIRAAMLAASA